MTAPAAAWPSTAPASVGFHAYGKLHNYAATSRAGSLEDCKPSKIPLFARVVWMAYGLQNAHFIAYCGGRAAAIGDKKEISGRLRLSEPLQRTNRVTYRMR